MSDFMIDGLFLMLGNLWLVPIGVMLGICVGAMPGLSASNSLAILLPVMVVLPPEQGLVLGVCIYAGAEMGNSFPAITLRIPGTAASAVTTIEGYPMMMRGEGARAIGICIMASTIGAIIGGLGALFAAPLIASMALSFSPVEICIIVIFGLAVIALISTGGLIKGLMCGMLGLLLATIGTDPVFGQFRGTFGIISLYDGLTVISVLVGLLGFSEVLRYAEDLGAKAETSSSDNKNVLALRGIMQGAKETLKRPVELIRSSLIGLGIGAVPGAGASVAAFVAYQQSMSFASGKKREEYGKGSIDGLIAADSANNAVVGGSLVPLLTLGVPGSASMAVLLVVMGYHGLSVGPRLFELNGDIAYAVLWSQFAAAFFILVLGTLLGFVAYHAARVQMGIIIPIISVFCMLGGFAKSQAIFDIGVMVFFGCVGYVMKKYNYPVIALLLGVVLGGLFEGSFFRGLRMGFDSPAIFFERPIAQVLWGLLVVTLLVPPIARYVLNRKK